MKPFTLHRGLVAPLDRANVDTDAIIPKQFLKSIARSGFGPNLFDGWRYLDPGEPGQAPESRRPNPDFVLNQPRYAKGAFGFAEGASILLARENFGCGSSREHAPWALEQDGYRALIAPSFADIFFNNCFKNGLLPLVLPAAQVGRLFDDVAAFPGFALTIDLPRQVVVRPDGEELPFDVEPFRKERLLHGLDDIGLTLRHADKVRAFEAERLARMPWLARMLGGEGGIAR
jgi:3-isopropylmalate/(R)-2-methylmalate dehydratase small subunit